MNQSFTNLTNQTLQIDKASLRTLIDAAGGSGGVSSWNDLTDKPFSVTTSTTQLFSESVTTEQQQSGFYGAVLTYSTAITADTLIVTFDGTDYTVNKTLGPEAEGGDGFVFYGEEGESGPDFTNYPFYLVSMGSGQNTIVTETAGTYSVSASSVVVTTTVTDDFALAVRHVIVSASSTPTLPPNLNPIS